MTKSKKTPKSLMRTDRAEGKLIRTIPMLSTHDLSDMILCMAINVEDALNEAGAIPGEDYTMKDLFQWAMPFAQHLFISRDDIDFSVENTHLDSDYVMAHLPSTQRGKTYKVEKTKDDQPKARQV